MSFVAEPLLTQLTPLIYKSSVGLVFTGLLGALMWPFRKARSEWTALKDSVAATREELVQQRENHLTHIEMYGKQQTELLTKACEALDGVRLDLKEQTGYLRASITPVRRTLRKK